VPDQLPDWEHWAYSADPELPIDEAIPLEYDRGNEANAYLTFIIDNYHDLPDITLFMHPHENWDTGGWHIDNPGESNAWYVQNLRLGFIQRRGYSNLRCMKDPGCAYFAFLREGRDVEDEFHAPYDFVFRENWPVLFPGVPTPPVIASVCCAQFAVSKARILERPRADYVRIWTWLMDTDIEDHYSGSLLEYTWQYIFGEEPDYCKDDRKCACDLYGENCIL
jgi:hypothetical protein